MNILSPRIRAVLTLDLTSSDNLSHGFGMVKDFESGVDAVKELELIQYASKI